MTSKDGVLLPRNLRTYEPNGFGGFRRDLDGLCRRQKVMTCSTYVIRSSGHPNPGKADHHDRADGPACGNSALPRRGVFWSESVCVAWFT